MSSAIVSLVQGAIAGGSAIYLNNRLSNEVKEKGNDRWTTVALQVNHLLLLTAETLYFAGSPLGVFGLVVKAVWVATPLAIIADFYGKEISLFTEKNAAAWNLLYKAGVVTASVATLILGNPFFAAASLSMLAIDAYYTDLSSVSKVAAVFGLVGYGAQAVAAKGAMAWMSGFAVMAVAIKQLVTTTRVENKPAPESSSKPEKLKQQQKAAEERLKAQNIGVQNKQKTVNIHHYHPAPYLFSPVYHPTPTYYYPRPRAVTPRQAPRQNYAPPTPQRQWTPLAKPQPSSTANTDSGWNFFSRPSVYAPGPAAHSSSGTSNSGWNFFTRASVWG